MQTLCFKEGLHFSATRKSMTCSMIESIDRQFFPGGAESGDSISISHSSAGWRAPELVM